MSIKKGLNVKTLFSRKVGLKKKNSYCPEKQGYIRLHNYSSISFLGYSYKTIWYFNLFYHYLTIVSNTDAFLEHSKS